MSSAASQYTSGTLKPLMSMPMICSAARRASASELASLMPPGLPRPPTGTWALTGTGPSLAKAAAASAGLRATTPGGIAMPSEASTSLAWYSRSFNSGGRVEWASEVLVVSAQPAVAKPALELGTVEHEDHEADAEQEHDHERETASNEDGRNGRYTAARGRLRACRAPRVAIPILKSVV